MIYTDDKYMTRILRRRKEDAHKGDFGKVLIFAGSVGMAGAAVLNGRAALKGGSGLVQFLLPRFTSPLLTILQICVPEATCVEMSPDFNISGYSAAAAGSGLGKSPESKEILSYIIKQCESVLVLDADGLNLIAGDEALADQVRSCKARVIITPHIGEAKRLLHTNEPIRDTESRIRAARALAEQYRCIAVLKGAGTLVADYREDQNDRIFENTTGNPGMATAGSGDALTGLIAALAAQGYEPLDAARTGVFLHGLAGDLAASELGQMSVTSSDIIAYLPYALKQYSF